MSSPLPLDLPRFRLVADPRRFGEFTLECACPACRAVARVPLFDAAASCPTCSAPFALRDPAPPRGA